MLLCPQFGRSIEPRHHKQERSGPHRALHSQYKEEAMATKLQAAIEQDDVAAWRGFAPGSWQSRVNVREFIQRNYTPYEGDGTFLQGPTDAHARHVADAAAAARARSARRASSTSRRCRPASSRTRPATSTRTNEIIVGLQTDAPLKRAIMPFGGWRVVAASLEVLRLQAGPARRRDLHQVPQDAQRRRVRRLHAGHPQGALVAASSPACPMPTAAAASSATTAAWRSTAWTS